MQGCLCLLSSEEASEYNTQKAEQSEQEEEWVHSLSVLHKTE
jgi:hypothetical protein